MGLVTAGVESLMLMTVVEMMIAVKPVVLVIVVKMVVLMPPEVVLMIAVKPVVLVIVVKMVVLMPPGVVLIIAVKMVVLTPPGVVPIMAAAQRMVMVTVPQREVVRLPTATHSPLWWLPFSFEGSALLSSSLMFFFHAPAVQCVPLLPGSEDPPDCQEGAAARWSVPTTDECLVRNAICLDISALTLCNGQ
jgi:hypothetical protein